MSSRAKRGICGCLCVALGCSSPTTTALEGQPPASAGHALVYHEGLQAVLLLNAGLGGMDGPAASTPTRIWRWNGDRWIAIDSSGPPIRNLAGVAYDSDRSVVVLVGGSYSLDLVYDETWEWSSSGGWTKRAVAGPGKRDHTDMAYDKERRRVVLHGGQQSLQSFPPSTWTWDGATWLEITTATGPGARIHHSMLYDPAGQRVLLFGGSLPPQGGEAGDTWAWNGSSWASAAPAVAPRGRSRSVRLPVN